MKDPACVIDISLPLGPPTPPIPGDPPFARRLFLTHETDGCEAAVWFLSAHSAAHIDFPAHFLAQGKRATDFPVAAFFPPAVVIDCGQALRLGPDVLAGVTIHPGDAVLFCTVNSREQRFAKDVFPHDFAAVTPQLARELITRRVSLVGLDAMSIEPLTDPAYPVHRLLLASDVLILEGLSLSQAAPGRYRLACPPLAVAEAEASPVRAVLWKEPA